MFESWNATPGRFFLAYRTRRDFSRLLGHGVVDEFRTISGPILLSPASMMGEVYDAGMQLADARDVEAPIDQGWPPLTVGIETKTQEPPDDWQAKILRAIKLERGAGTAPWTSQIVHASAGKHTVSIMRCSTDKHVAACFVVTDAPMLPEQLGRLAEIDSAPITVAVSTGNRLPRVTQGSLHQVDVVSEGQLKILVGAVQQCAA